MMSTPVFALFGKGQELAENFQLFYEKENRQKEEEICTILKQHHKDIIKNLEFDLSAIIRESLARINASIHNKYKWKRYLNPALVHKIVIEELANA